MSENKDILLWYNGTVENYQYNRKAVELMPDNHIYIDFTVIKSQILLKGEGRIASGTKNLVKARFTLLEDWEGIKPTAIFARDGIVLKKPVINGLCSIPKYMMNREGRFSVSVYGGDLKTTSTERSWVTVVKSGYLDENPPPIESDDSKLTYIKTMDDSLQYWRKNEYGLIEYSADGEVWTVLSGGGAGGGDVVYVSGVEVGDAPPMDVAKLWFKPVECD